MNTKLSERAEKLAAEPYTVEIILDETTDGEPVYLVSHPELPGCMAQGGTIEEATANLEDARKEYILSLLEDGLPVPTPSSRATETTLGQGITNVNEYESAGTQRSFLDDLSADSARAVQSIRRRWVGAISSQT